MWQLRKIGVDAGEGSEISDFSRAKHGRCLWVHHLELLTLYLVSKPSANVCVLMALGSVLQRGCRSSNVAGPHWGRMDKEITTTP